MVLPSSFSFFHSFKKYPLVTVLGPGNTELNMRDTVLPSCLIWNFLVARENWKAYEHLR